MQLRRKVVLFVAARQRRLMRVMYTVLRIILFLSVHLAIENRHLLCWRVLRAGAQTLICCVW